MESSKYISLLTEKEIQKIFEGIEKNTEGGRSRTVKRKEDKVSKKVDDQKTVPVQIGNRCKRKLRYIETVIGKIVNRKNCNYFKECQ